MKTVTHKAIILFLLNSTVLPASDNTPSTSSSNNSITQGAQIGIGIAIASAVVGTLIAIAFKRGWISLPTKNNYDTLIKAETISQLGTALQADFTQQQKELAKEDPQYRQLGDLIDAAQALSTVNTESPETSTTAITALTKILNHKDSVTSVSDLQTQLLEAIKKRLTGQDLIDAVTIVNTAVTTRLSTIRELQTDPRQIEVMLRDAAAINAVTEGKLLKQLAQTIKQSDEAALVDQYHTIGNQGIADLQAGANIQALTGLMQKNPAIRSKIFDIVEQFNAQPVVESANRWDPTTAQPVGSIAILTNLIARTPDMVHPEITQAIIAAINLDHKSSTATNVKQLQQLIEQARNQNPDDPVALRSVLEAATTRLTTGKALPTNPTEVKQFIETYQTGKEYNPRTPDAHLNTPVHHEQEGPITRGDYESHEVL